MKCFAILKDGRHPAFGRMLAISKLTELGGKIALPVAELQRALSAKTPQCPYSPPCVMK
jgi:hypothetical protein